jgi:nitroimidazol reductase NimA-like FMN-containing flavoprotein (pyridoxamine 5'-phosphate oxidase superfamily)
MALIDDGLEILSEDACHDLLRGHTLGRVAITVGALPAIFPVNYATLDGDIVFLTGVGTKLHAALAHAVVAFQIDDFDPAHPGGWSVMAVGIADEITDHEELAAAAGLRLRPFAGGDRTHYVKIRPEFVSGRRVVT